MSTRDAESSEAGGGVPVPSGRFHWDRCRGVGPRRWLVPCFGGCRWVSNTACGVPPRPSAADASSRLRRSVWRRPRKLPGLVSVVLPVYNHAAMLRDAIESVLAQTYSDFELILVNDGSTRRRGSRCWPSMSGIRRVRILTQANQKLPKALSNGFEFARGEFWTWTSADNLMHPDQLRRQVEFLQQPRRRRDGVRRLHGHRRRGAAAYGSCLPAAQSPSAERSRKSICRTTRAGSA